MKQTATALFFGLLGFGTSLPAWCVGGSDLPARSATPALATAGTGGDAKEGVAIDDKGLLANRNMPTDPAKLIAFFKEWSGGAEDVILAPELVKQLASKDKAESKKAHDRLLELGPAAFPWLAAARAGPDRDLINAAKECVEEIHKEWRMFWVLPAAVRILAREGPPEAAPALLRFLPYAAQGELEEEVWYALDALVQKHGKVDGAFMDALNDPVPARRAAASYLLGRWGSPDQQAQVIKKGLADRDAEVRLRAAQGLLGSQHKEVVPTLIDLLPASPVPLAWQAEELLCWAAGDTAPGIYLGAASRAATDKCHKAWKQWWAKQAGTFELAKAFKRTQRPGLFLVAVHFGQEKLWSCGFDAKPRWLWENNNPKRVTELIDQVILPNGRLLIAKLLAQDIKSTADVNVVDYGISELDLEGRVLWRVAPGLQHVYGCRRLSNGNTLVNVSGVLEITPEGTVATRHHVDRTGVGPKDRFFPIPPYRLDNGRWLYELKTSSAGKSLVVSDDKGRQVGQILPPAKLRPLPLESFVNYIGNGLVQFLLRNERALYLVNARGELVWNKTDKFVKVDQLVSNEPNEKLMGALILRKGHLILGYLRENTGGSHQIIVDNAGNVLWEATSEMPAWGRPCFDVLRLGFDAK
jgi:hypothetical protein